MRIGRALQIALVTGLIVALTAPIAGAQETAEYVIGPGDVLSVAVWRHADLDRQIVVGTNGTVTFPPVGELTAAGLTPTALSRGIMQRLRDYTRETTQVTVSVAQYNSRAVFLTGQVMAPGRYSFERIPDILQLLSQAGGPLPSADLSNVSVVRPTPTGPRVIKADVGGYMRGQATTPLPVLQPGDTVEIPALAATGGLAGPGLVYIFGEVNMPGAYPTFETTDVLQLISLAGGTTPEARLDEVAVVMDGAGGQVVAQLDLERTIREGTGDPFILSPGDRVVIFPKSTNVAVQILGGAATVLGYARDVMSAYLLYLTVDREIDARGERDAATAAAAEAAGVAP
jgi:polysaccharide export outer membrane protein